MPRRTGGACPGSNSRRGMPGTTILKELKTNAPTSCHSSHTSPPRRSAPTAAAKSRQTRMWFQHGIASGMPSCSAAQHAMSVGASFSLQNSSTSCHPPSHTSPPNRSAPTAAAKSRQTGTWFQHGIASGMPSCSVAQHAMSVGGYLQPQNVPTRPQSEPIPLSSFS